MVRTPEIAPSNFSEEHPKLKTKLWNQHPIEQASQSKSDVGSELSDLYPQYV